MTCTAAMNGAESVTYKQAREMKTPISEMALYSGLRWATIEIAQPIAIPANKMKRTASISWFSLRNSVVLCATVVNRRDLPQRPGAPQRLTERLPQPTRRSFQKLAYVIKQRRPLQRRRQDDVDDCEWHQKLPAKAHQLIEAKARQRAAQPDVQEKKQDHFAEKVEHAQRRQLVHEWPVPTAEKQGRRQHRNREHVDVLGKEEQRELHRAVFGVKTGNKFSLGFRQIERYSVRLSNRRNQVD